MQETLADHDPTAPLREQPFYELRIDEWDEIRGVGLFVRERHYQWSEIDRRIMSTETPVETAETYPEARRIYESRRQRLIGAGFTHSDLDF